MDWVSTQTHYSDSELTTVIALPLLHCVFSDETTNTNFIDFGLTRPSVEATIYSI
jgi:hypothetical protein